MEGESLSEFFEQSEFDEIDLAGAASPEDIFSALEALEGVSDFNPITVPLDGINTTSGNLNSSKDGEDQKSPRLVSQKSTSSSALQDSENELETSGLKRKRHHLTSATASSHEETIPDGQQRMSHITVERNRRKQMNEHLTVLRSLMPCFYVKRGDQASIIGGVVDYINELQLVLQSLEAKKQRKVYSEVLSPRIISPSPRSSPLSPRKPPLSPRLSLPLSPRTPQPSSPYMPRTLQQGYLSPTMASPLEPSPTSSSTSSIDSANELVANSRSAIAEVEVKFSGPNVLLKTVSPRIPGQALKIISALEDLSLEVLHVNISTIDEKMLNSFTIKIGIECQLSADELAQLIQHTFLVP